MYKPSNAKKAENGFIRLSLKDFLLSGFFEKKSFPSKDNNKSEILFRNARKIRKIKIPAAI